MINLVSMLAVMTLFSGAVIVIAATLRDHADAIIAALAGRSLHAELPVAVAPRVRVTIRTPLARPVPFQPLRAAA